MATFNSFMITAINGTHSSAWMVEADSCLWNEDFIANLRHMLLLALEFRFRPSNAISPPYPGLSIRLPFDYFLLHLLMDTPPGECDFELRYVP